MEVNNTTYSYDLLLFFDFFTSDSFYHSFIFITPYILTFHRHR